jgi:hypothetical protein
MTPTRGIATRAAALRAAGSRGATLVEYALVMSLVVLAGASAYELLTAAADSEIENQADCVSDRPPPESECGFAPVPTDVVTPNPNIAPPTTGVPVDDPDLFAVSAGPADAHDDPWTLLLPVHVTVEVQEPPTEPAGTPGIRVRARIQMEDPNQPGVNLPTPGFTDCVTDADGNCELVFTVPFEDVTRATMLVIGVDSPRPPDGLPPLVTFERSG